MFQGTLEPRSNRESFLQLIALIDPDTNQPFDITGFTIEFEIRRLRPFGHYGYIQFYDYDCATDFGPMLVATTANGAATIVGTGVIQIYFSETQMKTLPPQTYSACCTITDPTAVNVKQILACKLPILPGGVTT